MKLWKLLVSLTCILIIAGGGGDYVFGQIYSKVEKNNYKIVTIKSQGKIVSIDKKEKDKAEEKLTILDGVKFTELTKGQEVNIDKSKDIGYGNQANDLITTAKKDKIIIEIMNDKGNKIKYDLSKENEKSVYYNLKAALKAGYKKDGKVKIILDGKKK